MNRRAVLITTGGVMIGLSGCLGGNGDDRDDGDGDDGEDGDGDDGDSTLSNTSTDSPDTDTPEFELLDFSNQAKGCGEHAEGSLASYADMELNVGGSLAIPTQCYEGQFREVRYDSATDTAEVIIEAVQLESDDDCTSKCEGVYKYTAVVGVSNRMPENSKLIHVTAEGEEKKRGAYTHN